MMTATRHTCHPVRLTGVGRLCILDGFEKTVSLLTAIVERFVVRKGQDRLLDNARIGRKESFSG